MTSPPSTMNAAVRAVATTWRVPFSLYAVGATGGVIHVEVQIDQLQAARAYFSERKVVLSNGRVVPVRLTGVRAEQWESWPVRPPTEVPAQVPEGLIGMDVDEATRLANATGWVVRACEPDAAITADLWPVRINIVYDEHRRVLEYDVG